MGGRCKIFGFAVYLLAALLCRGQGIITTIAGADIAYPGSSFSALSASFGQLSGVAVSPSGDVYFASQSRSMILRFNPSLNSMSIVAGIGVGGYSGDGGPAANASLDQPLQIAFDAAGNLYIADLQNAAIRKIDTEGIITTFATTGSPNGLAVGPDGTLYISNYTEIFHAGVGGALSVIAGSQQPGYGGDGGPATSALLNAPSQLLFDNAGNLLVVDRNNFRIRRIDTHGTITTIAGNGQSGPSVNGPATSTGISANGIAVDAEGNLYVGTGSDQLLKIDSSGSLSVLNSNASIFFLTSPGPVTKANLNPQYLSLDQAGNLYFNGRVLSLAVSTLRHYPVGRRVRAELCHRR